MDNKYKELARSMFDSREILNDSEQEVLVKALIIDFIHWDNQMMLARVDKQVEMFKMLRDQVGFFINFICTKNSRMLNTRAFITKQIIKEYKELDLLSGDVGKA